VKRVLIHTKPRSGSKTLQLAIQEHLTKTYKLVSSINRRPYGLGEFFVYDFRYEFCITFDAKSSCWINQQFTSQPNAFWDSLVLNKDKINFAPSFIPANEHFLISAEEFLTQQLKLINDLKSDAFVAKIFDGQIPSSLQPLLIEIYSKFDTHLILTRDPLENFLSLVVSLSENCWLASSDRKVASFYAQRESFDRWVNADKIYRESINLLPSPTVVNLEDFHAGTINVRGEDLQVKPIIEYGNSKYGAVLNLAEVKSWFNELGHSYT